MVEAAVLLRGVNVGGKHRIGMDVLRELCAALGAADVRTCLQSGNAVVRIGRTNLPGFGARLENAIEERLGFRPAVMLRTAAELSETAGRNPFAGRPGLDPSRMVVLFLAGEPDEEARGRVDALSCATEEVRIGKREVFAYFHQGQARPKVTASAMEKAAGFAGTGRNWNTVQRLLALMRETAVPG